MATNPTVTLPTVKLPTIDMGPGIPAGQPRTPFFNPEVITKKQYQSGPVDFYSQTLDTTGVGVVDAPDLGEDEDEINKKRTDHDIRGGDDPFGGGDQDDNQLALSYSMGKGYTNKYELTSFDVDDINFGPDSNNTYDFSKPGSMTMDKETGKVSRDLNGTWADSLFDYTEQVYEGAKAASSAARSQALGLDAEGKEIKDLSFADQVAMALDPVSGGARPFGPGTTTVGPGGAVNMAAGVFGALATAAGGMSVANHAYNAAAYRATGGSGGFIGVVGSNEAMISRMPGGGRDSLSGMLEKSGLKDPFSGVPLSRNYLGGQHFIYDGLPPGMTHSMMAAREAASYGFVPGTLQERFDTGTARYVKSTSMVNERGQPLMNYLNAQDMSSVGGTFNPKTGNFIDLNGRSYGGGTRKAAEAYVGKLNKMYGSSLHSDEVAVGRREARKAGITFVDYMERKAYTSSGILDRLDQRREAMANRTEAEKQAAEAIQTAADQRAKAAVSMIEDGGYDPRDDSYGAADDEMGDVGIGGGGDFADDSTATGDEDYDDLFADGGRVSMQMGGPAGFVERPPSQVSDGQTVADDVPATVGEGTFVINAPAVEFAGEADIRKLLDDAYAKVAQRGVAAPSQEQIDIAVSRGEVIIPPEVAKEIGYDKLKKINNRGKKEVSRRQAERQEKSAAGGGFISRKKFHSGGEAHSHDAKAAIGVADITSKYSETSEDKEIDDLQKEQYTRKSLTPTFKSKAEKELYNKGVQFGDTEVFADILGKTNFNKLIQAAARDSRTLSDTVTTLRPGENMANPFHRNAMGLYAQYGREPYTSPVYKDGDIDYTDTMNNRMGAKSTKGFRSDVSNTAILVRSPTEFGGPSTDLLTPPMSYTATLAHELMHRGADVLRNDPNFNPTRSLVAMQELYARLPSITKYIDGEIDYETYSKAKAEKRTNSDAEHRYIAAVVGQAYLRRNIESVRGAFEKSQKPPKGFEKSFGKLTGSDLVNEAKQNILYETRRVFDSYLNPANKKQFFEENSLFELNSKYDSLDLKIGHIYSREDVNEIPFEKIAAAYDSINRIMAEDYATILFKNAVVDKPVNIPRRKNPPKTTPAKAPLQDATGAATGSQPAPEQKYERGFLDKMLGVTPAY